MLSFRGKSDLWQEGADIPDAFHRVHHGWATFVHHGITKNGKQVLAPLGKIKKLLQSPDPFTRGQVPRLWQEYLTVFRNDTFLSGLLRIFGAEHDWDVPGGEIWTEEIDIPLFGALGQGSGGFKALYGQAWAQLARLEANALEDNQATFAKIGKDGEIRPAPIQDLARTMAVKAQQLGAELKLNTRAINYSVRRNEGRYETVVTTMTGDDVTSEIVYDIVVVCTTTRTMNVGMSSLTDYRDEDTNVLPVKVSAAINGTSMISSSKVFIRTRKFWDDQGPDFPRVILSDTLASQLYTLDYGHPEFGVVLLLYVWGEDADQIQGIRKKEEMLRIVKERVTSVVRRTPWPDYADYLEPLSLDDVDVTHWNLHEPALGAFALTRPGQEKGTAQTFYSPFEIHNGVYVGGDGVSFNGGWTEGGLMTGMNIVSAVLKKYGELNARGADEAPVNRLTPDLYIY